MVKAPTQSVPLNKGDQEEFIGNNNIFTVIFYWFNLECRSSPTLTSAYFIPSAKICIIEGVAQLINTNLPNLEVGHPLFSRCEV
jgi:hypothetical protein